MQGLPPGFRFEPTDEELIIQYLMRKVRGETLPQSRNHIVEYDLYGKKSPWDLFQDGQKSPWDLFQDRHYVLTVLKKTSEKGGKRYSRVAGEGTWHGNTARIPVYDQFKNKIGVKKQFTFKTKDKNHGEWIMHEYSLNDQEPIVLCEIIKKQKKKSGSRNYVLMADHGVDSNRFLNEYDGGKVANSVPEGGNNGMVDAPDYAAYFTKMENYCSNIDDFLLETNDEDGENGWENSEKECPATPTLPPPSSL